MKNIIITLAVTVLSLSSCGTKLSDGHGSTVYLSSYNFPVDSTICVSRLGNSGWLPVAEHKDGQFLNKQGNAMITVAHMKVIK